MRRRDEGFNWPLLRRFFWLGRNTFPILDLSRIGRPAVIARFDDVKEVLDHSDIFDVTYAPKIREIMDGDNIFLGMSGEAAMREKATLRLTAPPAEAISRVKPQVTALTEAVMAKAAPSGRVDIAMQLTQEVTTRFFGAYFGTPGRDVKTLSDQARVCFDYMFADLHHDPALARRANAAAAELRTYVEEVIAARKQARGQHDDILERCLALQDAHTEGMDDRGIRNNLIGLIVGAMPQAPMLIPQLFTVLLDRPKALAAAQAAAMRDDDAEVSRYVFEASRFFPLTPALSRQATADYVLAAGTPRAHTIRAGTPVMALTGSAMFDGRRLPRPNEFRTDRPEGAYMHFGAGMHECFGLYMNREMVPAICKAVLRRPGLRRAAGDAGRLKVESIFPTSLVVEFDA